MQRIKQEAAEAIAAERSRVDQQLSTLYADQESRLRDSSIALAEQGVDPKDIATIIRAERDKAIQEAADIRAKAAADADKIKHEAKYRLLADGEMDQLRKLDPTISSINSLMDKPYAKELLAKVDRGYSIMDAYNLVNMDDIVDKAVSKAKQATLAKSATKQHLNPTTDRGGSKDAPIPPAIKAKFRELMPKATNAEIQKYWNKDKARNMGKS